MKNLIIKSATAEDAPELQRLNVEFNGGPGNDTAAIARSLCTNKNEVVAIAKLNGKAIGFCCGQIFSSMCYEEPAAEITELYVMEKYRRIGAAKAMIEYTEKAFLDAGASEIHLLTGAKNVGAQAFYSKCGYIKSNEVQFCKELKQP